jgi:membrane fusion protein, multidrug efflux system
MFSQLMSRRWIGSIAMIAAVSVGGVALAAWKHAAIQDADAAAASQPEPVESIETVLVSERPYSPKTTAIGTVVAMRSISVRNELPGTVRRVSLVPGQIVEPGTVLVGLDVAVERADLNALKAQSALAHTQFERVIRLQRDNAVSAEEVDSARAARDVALAQVARVEAIIERKTIRAPFRARVGISDVHIGQYLNEGAYLTTLQGVDASTYVDFVVAQHVSGALREGDKVQVFAADAKPIAAAIMATDARIDPTTRNATVRAKITDARNAPGPGASVRVQVPVGVARLAAVIPASALRKGPGGDYVFVVAPDKDGKTRAQSRLVQVEALAGDEIVIREGLKTGEQVAASGSFKLRDSALVSIIPKAEAVAANAGETAATSNAM